MCIETKRLYLRPFVLSDFEDFYEYMADPELRRMAGFEKINDKETARKEFNTFIENKTYAIVYKESSKAIGNFGVEPLFELLAKDPCLKGKNGVTLSFALSEQYRRKGLISEAMEKMIDYLFNERKVDFINCGYFSFNQASCSLQKKFGFKYYGTHTVHRGDLEIETIENILFNKNAVNYEIVKLNEATAHFLPHTNQPFDVIGRFVPSYDGDKWSYKEILYGEKTQKTYENEAIDPKDYIDSSKRAVFLAVCNDLCIGTVYISVGWRGMGYIEDLSVDTAYRHMGVGKKLMDSAVNWCREQRLNRIVLETQDNNLQACRFYVKYGFELCGIDTKKYVFTEYENEISLYFYMKL